MVNFGGSGMTRECYDWIVDNIPKGETILELGAGIVSTDVLSKEWKLYSVEDNEEYMNVYEKANYIYAPKVNGWYDVDALRHGLPKEYSLIIVDGPHGNRLDGLVDNIDLFNIKDIPIIIDDTYRPSEFKIVEYFQNTHNKKIIFNGKNLIESPQCDPQFAIVK